ncbi:MAG: biotin/lipoyl-containing protein, partial [Acidimicrobiales bacterium]
MADITMPQLGETVTEGTITKWHKQVGDSIAEDEVLFEVSTDKVDSEVPCPVSGTVLEILVPEGETVSVGSKLAVVGVGATSGDGAGTAGTERAGDSSGAAVDGQAGKAGGGEAEAVPGAPLPAPAEPVRAEAPADTGTVAEAEAEPLGA